MTVRLPPASEGVTRPAPDDALFAGAMAVLGHNWHALHTLPATGLYPHQWSWDSAFIAIGSRHLSPRRAAQEMDSLLCGQWSDGRIPQIVFDPARDDDYSPGPSFWRSDLIPGAPATPTAGLIQPPNHAWACLLVHQADPQESERRQFLRRIYPKLLAWHEYLAVRRSRGRSGLACVIHPWETGMDNAPAWDAVLSGVTATRLREQSVDIAIPRPDLLHASASERPTNAEYANYLYLAARYRDHRCDDLDSTYPFVVEDPAFNAIWAASELAMAEIATLCGVEAGPHRDRAAAITDALSALWNADLDIYLARNVLTGELLQHAGIAGLIPLILPGAPHPRKLLGTLLGPRFALGRSILIPSYDLTASDYDGARYWRGPAWFNTAWMLVQGLRRHGFDDHAAALARVMRQAALAHNFPEYVDPRTGEAHGTRLFSWTAALALDVGQPLG